MRASIKGGEGEGRRNGICAHKRTSVIGILTASTNGEPRDMRLLACGSVGYEKGGRWCVRVWKIRDEIFLKYLFTFSVLSFNAIF